MKHGTASDGSKFAPSKAIDKIRSERGLQSASTNQGRRASESARPADLVALKRRERRAPLRLCQWPCLPPTESFAIGRAICYPQFSTPRRAASQRAGGMLTLRARPMITPPQPKSRFAARSLLGILFFLRKYPGRVALCLGLLLVNISIEMTLPQILGNAISGLRRQLADHQDFLLHPFVVSYFVLISLRAAVGLTLGPIRSRT